MYNSLYGILVQISVFLILIGFVSFLLYRHRKKQKYSPFTEKFLRPPGSSLDKELEDLLDKMIMPIMLIAFLPYVCVIQWSNSSIGVNKMLLLLSTAVIIYCLFKLRNVLNKAMPLRLGLEGELYSGSELNYLMRDGAWVYHDIPYQYGNIDHIVISTGGVFAIETKAVRKPAKDNRRADYEVIIDGEKLIFPHVTTGQSINQARTHAKYLSEVINRMTGIKHTVTPVVALPGWFIQIKNANTNTLIINPKRGSALRSRVLSKVLSVSEATLIAEHIETFARDLNSKSDITDPDGNSKYDFFNNRKPTERKL